MNNVIVLDLDGVIVNFHGGFARRANDLFGAVCPTHPYHATHYDLSYKGNLTPGQADKVWESIWESRSFWIDLPSLLGEEETQEFADFVNSHTVYFVTQREGSHVENQTYDWLRINGIKRPCVVVTRYKGEVAKAINARYSLDDKAGNAIAISYIAPLCKSYLLDRPYNQFDHHVTGGRVMRVRTVCEFMQIIRGAA